MNAEVKGDENYMKNCEILNKTRTCRPILSNHSVITETSKSAFERKNSMFWRSYKKLCTHDKTN